MEGNILHRQCSWCRRVYRDGRWVHAVLDETKLDITHGLCPECLERHYPECATPSVCPPTPPPTPES